MVTLPRESWMVLAATGGGVALVQTARLWWRASSARWRLAAQSARATAGEALAEKLLTRAGYRIDAFQYVHTWKFRVDGEAREVTLRADFVVSHRGRRYVAEVKTGSDAPDATAPATRRQLLEYRCAFDVDGVLLVDAEARRIERVDFDLPSPPRPRLWPLLLAIALAVLLAAALARADVTAPPTATGDCKPGASKRVLVCKDRIQLLDTIYFDTAKATIKSTSLSLLDELTATLRAHPEIAIEVGVHTDERGDDHYNLHLSTDRANAVADYLQQHGARHVEARGYGETKPLCNEHNETCWAKNRRVELLRR